MEMITEHAAETLVPEKEVTHRRDKLGSLPAADRFNQTNVTVVDKADRPRHGTQILLILGFGLCSVLWLSARNPVQRSAWISLMIFLLLFMIKNLQSSTKNRQWK